VQVTASEDQIRVCPMKCVWLWDLNPVAVLPAGLRREPRRGERL
jgi:hypothetical protein